MRLIGGRAFVMWLLKKSIIQRGAAILLLAFALADLSSTDICSEKLEMLGFPDKVIAGFTDTSTSAAPTPVAINSSGQRQPSDSTPQDDDCLCWCPHVLPSLVFHFNALVEESPAFDSFNPPLPSAPPQHFFRPPRLA